MKFYLSVAFIISFLTVFTYTPEIKLGRKYKKVYNSLFIYKRNRIMRYKDTFDLEVLQNSSNTLYKGMYAEGFTIVHL